MSKNKAGEGHLPSDQRTPTDGSNYGLDGDPGLDYNSGLMAQFFDESMLAQLPDGVTARDPGTMADHEFFEDVGGLEDDDYLLESGDEADAAWFADDEGVDSGLHLDDWMKDGGVQDLDWLELNEQDADRLPKNPVNLAIPELEEAWGTERRTDGFNLQADNQPVDELAFWESTQRGDETEYAPSYHFSNEDLFRVVRKAVRRSASGWNLKALLVEAAESLGEEAPRIKDAMEQIKAAHGLAGNVFIQAGAYPGLYRGKSWSKTLKKAARARYIIVDERTLKGSTLIHNGNCTVTGKKAVLEVPWAEAYALYKPHLEGAGRKVAGGDPRVALQRAFLSSPESVARPSSPRPTHATPSERVSSEDAKRQLAAQSADRQVIDRTNTREAKLKRQAWARVNHWIEAGLVPRDQAMAVVGGDVPAMTMLHRVSALIVRAKGAVAFSGLPNDVRPPRATKAQVKAALAGWTPPEPIDVSHRAKEAAGRQVVTTLTRWVRAGFLTRDQASKLAKANASPEAKLRAASKLIMGPRAASLYSGAANDRRVAPENDPRALKAALKKSEDEKKAMQARIDAMANQKRADSSRAAKKIKAAKDLVAVIEGAINRGVRGSPLRDLIRRTIPKSQAKLAGQYLVPLLKRTGAHKNPPKNARTYEGPTMRPHQSRAASVAPKPRRNEAASAIQFCKEAMNQGVAGRQLTRLLRSKFSETVLKTAKKRLKAVRGEHEGGAGFIYVDAGTYASRTGTKGCEVGGKQHRANRLRFVMAMGRCAGCALSSRKSDSSSVCRVYNKELVAVEEMPEEMPHLRKANIDGVGMSDAERTASMFAPSYDPGEFDLGANSPLNDIDFHREAEDDGEIQFTFGGIEF